MTGAHEARAPISPLAGVMLVLTAGLWGRDQFLHVAEKHGIEVSLDVTAEQLNQQKPGGHQSGNHPNDGRCDEPNP